MTDFPGFDFTKLTSMKTIAAVFLTHGKYQARDSSSKLRFWCCCFSEVSLEPGSDGFQKPSSCFLAAVRGTVRARLKGQVSRKAGPLLRAPALSTLRYSNEQRKPCLCVPWH